MSSIVEQLRRPRVLGMAVFDWVASLVGAVLVGLALGLRGPGQHPWQWASWIVFWVAAGVVVHAAVGVPTMLGYYLGFNARPR